MAMFSNPNIKNGNARCWDYKLAFDYWLEYTTVEKAMLAFHRDGHGIVQEDGTVNPVAYATFQRGAWVWVIENPDEALKIWQSRGYFLDGKDEKWRAWMAKKIRTHTCNQARIDAIKRCELEDIYERMFGQKICS